MTRSPLAAWRRLFAIGAAPAASHVRLSRAPSSNRLLEPLSGARVARATALEALTQPLDIGGMLAKVATGSSPNSTASAEDVVERTRSRRVVGVPTAGESRAPQRVELPSEVGSRSRAPHTGESTMELPRAPRALRAAALLTADVGKTSRRIGAGASHGAHRLSPPLPARLPRDAAGDERFVNALSQPANLGTEYRRDDNLGGTSDVAAHGANARVVVNQATSDVVRLLESVDPGQGVAALRSSAVQREDPNSAATGTGSLLAAAVTRAGCALAAPKAVETIPGSLANERTTAGSAIDATRGATTNASATASEAVSRGGFRGLAQRTLTTSRASSTVAPQRVEPESRISSDLAIDTLDSRVADSLARILEREARRHGIDIDEARS